MVPISFRNRIALYYSVTTAALVFVVFAVIFVIVKAGVYSDIDHDLQKEIDDLFTEIKITGNGFNVEQEEWYEKEHNTLNVNPIFIQFTDNAGQMRDRSPNLKKSQLKYSGPAEEKFFYNALLDSIRVRQAQVPVYSNGKTIGYMLVAAPLEDAEFVLTSLKRVLFIAYPLLLALLFSIARLLAGRSITPVKDIIDTARKISHENLSDRIPYPQNRDELYTLSKTINNLLDRIEKAVLREKQFTSDASHELRTPVAVIKGTLEVLIRKPRSQEEFHEKIKFCIAEMDRINLLVDQLLLLARFETQKQAVNIEEINMNAALLDVISRHSQPLKDKNIVLTTAIDPAMHVGADNYLLAIVLDNVISNAIKYSGHGGALAISGKDKTLEISDSGIGIAAEDLEKVFSPFYRSRAEDHAATKGSGLGLSIAKRICELLEVEISIRSELHKGTTVQLQFADADVALKD